MQRLYHLFRNQSLQLYYLYRFPSMQNECTKVYHCNSYHRYIATSPFFTRLHIKLWLACIDAILSQCSTQVIHRQSCPCLILAMKGSYTPRIKTDDWTTLEEPDPENGWVARARPPVAFVRIRAC